MTVPAWPTTLPLYFQEDDYSRSMPENTLRSPMDIGPAKVRRRSTAGAEPFSASTILTEAQFVIFRAFYKDDILDGSLRFSHADPDSRVQIEMRFTAVPEWTRKGTNYIANFQLEILP